MTGPEEATMRRLVRAVILLLTVLEREGFDDVLRQELFDCATEADLL